MALIATRRQKHNTYLKELLNEHTREPAQGALTVVERMQECLKTPEYKAIYKKRKQTVEPVFGIIKEVLGFRRFSLRGLRKTNVEWELVCLAYNLKRMFKMSIA